MSVPKTAMDKNRGLPGGENKIGRTWKIFAMKRKTITEPVQYTTDFNFGRRVFSFYARHDEASADFTYVISHR
jgi:hypothetical protein